MALCKSLCPDAQPLHITAVEAGSNLSAITMPSALLSAEGAYILLGTHSSGREPCHRPLDLRNPSLALVGEESIQSKVTVCWWPNLVMPYFAFSVVWSVTVAYLRLTCIGSVIRDVPTERSTVHPCTVLYAAFIIITIALTNNYHSVILQAL